jgi:hypothetical protein
MADEEEKEKEEEFKFVLKMDTARIYERSAMQYHPKTGSMSAICLYKN